MTSIKDIVHRQLGAIAAARASGAAPLKPAKTEAEILGLAFVPGQRVLDTTTGQEATVRGSTIKHAILPAS